jgi:hypothetical protein
MQQPNEICNCCAAFWKSRKKPGRLLQRTLNPTQNHKMIVTICSHCDGDAVQISRQAK